MSTDWVKDIQAMHKKFGVKERVNQLDIEKLKAFINFKFDCLKEELDESSVALYNKDPEEFVDGYIDLIVFALDTLNALDVDIHKAWDEVYDKNMQKEVGIKEGRPNPFNLPDLIKPKGWEAPNHKGNYGKIEEAFK